MTKKERERLAREARIEAIGKLNHDDFANQSDFARYERETEHSRKIAMCFGDPLSDYREGTYTFYDRKFNDHDAKLHGMIDQVANDFFGDEPKTSTRFRHVAAPYHHTMFATRRKLTAKKARECVEKLVVDVKNAEDDNVKANLERMFNAEDRRFQVTVFVQEVKDASPTAANSEK